MTHDPLENWAGNYIYASTDVLYPGSIEQAQEMIRRHNNIKVLGSRHSFNGIADSNATFISTDRLDRIVELDQKRLTVTLEAGVRYGSLCQYLNEHGYAIHNMASLASISVAGACATATHGSGDGNGNLATAVSAVELISPDGELQTYSRESDPERFDSVVVHLGAIGMVARLTLDLEPAFVMRQYVYENLPFSQMENHFDDITSSAYSVSLFTDWQGPRFNQVWFKCRDPLESDPARWGATPAPAPRHPLEGLPVEFCTEQMGVAGPWCDRLPHFRMGFTPSHGEELQTEYFVPRRHALDALNVVRQLAGSIAPLVYISEIRTVKADRLWMSPCFGQDVVGIHFTWKPLWPDVEALLPAIEARLEPFEARPHWGKLFTMQPAQFQPHFGKLPAFRALVEELDPAGKFRNVFLKKYITQNQG